MYLNRNAAIPSRARILYLLLWFSVLSKPLTSSWDELFNLSDSRNNFLHCNKQRHTHIQREREREIETKEAEKKPRHFQNRTEKNVVMSVTTTFMFCLTAGAVNPATENKSSSPSAQPNINSSPPAKTICLWSAADSMAFLEHPPLLVASARERSATSVRVLFQIIGSDVSFFPPWFTAVKNKFD